MEDQIITPRQKNPQVKIAQFSASNELQPHLYLKKDTNSGRYELGIVIFMNKNYDYDSSANIKETINTDPITNEEIRLLEIPVKKVGNQSGPVYWETVYIINNKRPNEVKIEVEVGNGLGGGAGKGSVYYKDAN